MDVQLIEPQDPHWTELLARVDHDLYHLPEYVRIAAEHEGGEPLGVVITDGRSTLLLPLVVRPITVAGVCRMPGYFDAVSPYGYPHPLVIPTAGVADDGFYAAALAALPGALREHRIVTAFLRLHPLFDFPVEEASAFGAVVTHGQTVAIDLTRGSQLLSGMRKNHRRRIDRGLLAGHTMRVTDFPEDIPDFVDIYVENMAGVDAAAYYFFSSEHFEALMRQLPGNIHLAFLEIGKRRASAVMFSEVCGTVEYHLGGTRSEFRKQSPMVLLTYLVARWAQERGNKVLHLGGGVGGREDSLFHFKAGFSPLRYPFRTWRLIADPEAYEELTHLWEQQTGERAEDPSDFFPIYRKNSAFPTPNGTRRERVPDGGRGGLNCGAGDRGPEAGPEAGPSANSRLVIVGAGDQGRKVLGTFLQRGQASTIVGFVDDSPLLRESSVDGWPVLGGLNWLVGHSREYQAVVAAKDDAERRVLVDRLKRAGVRVAKEEWRP